MFKFFKNDINLRLSLLRIVYSTSYVLFQLMSVSLYEADEYRSLFSIFYGTNYWCYNSIRHLEVNILWFVYIYNEIDSKNKLRIRIMIY